MYQQYFVINVVWGNILHLILEVPGYFLPSSSLHPTLRLHKYTGRYLFLKKRFYLFLVRGRERERETSMCGCLWSTPYWRPGPQPRCVPWLGIKPATRSVHRPVLNPLSHTSQGCYLFISTLNRRLFSVFLNTFPHNFKGMIYFTEKLKIANNVNLQVSTFSLNITSPPDSGSFSLTRLLIFIFLLKPSLQWWH